MASIRGASIFWKRAFNNYLSSRDWMLGGRRVALDRELLVPMS